MVGEPLAVVDVTIVTGDAAGTLVPHSTVLVGAGGTIEAVGPAADTAVPGGHRRIDAGGRFLVPGLINAHAHLFSDGRPLPAIMLKESTAAVTARLSRSLVGRKVFKRRARANALTQLHSGVTTLRSVGDVAYEVVEVAGAIDRGTTSARACSPPGPCSRSPVDTGRRRSRSPATRRGTPAATPGGTSSVASPL